MRYEEIKERVGWGEEFDFCYNGEQYWISQSGSERYLTKAKSGESQTFASTQELFDNGKIEGKTLKEIWEEIDKYF